MAIEIERKFLLANADWRLAISRAINIKQGYLNSNKSRTVRVRIANEQGFITVKGMSQQNARAEFEYEIPYADALQLIELCEQPIIEKTRYEVLVHGNCWEIDVFTGENAGLIVAEIELESQEQAFVRPTWLGKEVSDDARYFNASLITYPFGMWGEI